jgi:hypothetical protein
LAALGAALERCDGTYGRAPIDSEERAICSRWRSSRDMLPCILFDPTEYTYTGVDLGWMVVRGYATRQYRDVLPDLPHALA